MRIQQRVAAREADVLPDAPVAAEGPQVRQDAQALLQRHRRAVAAVVAVLAVEVAGLRDVPLEREDVHGGVALGRARAVGEGGRVAHSRERGASRMPLSAAAASASSMTCTATPPRSAARRGVISSAMSLRASRSACDAEDARTSREDRVAPEQRPLLARLRLGQPLAFPDAKQRGQPPARCSTASVGLSSKASTSAGNAASAPAPRGAPTPARPARAGRRAGPARPQRAAATSTRSSGEAGSHPSVRRAQPSAPETRRQSGYACSSAMGSGGVICSADRMRNGTGAALTAPVNRTGMDATHFIISGAFGAGGGVAGIVPVHEPAPHETRRLLHLAAARTAATAGLAARQRHPRHQAGDAERRQRHTNLALIHSVPPQNIVERTEGLAPGTLPPA